MTRYFIRPLLIVMLFVFVALLVYYVFWNYELIDTPLKWVKLVLYLALVYNVFKLIRLTKDI